MQQLEQDIRAFEEQLCAKYNKEIKLYYTLNKMTIKELLKYIKEVTGISVEVRTREIEYVIVRHLYFKMASDMGYTRVEIGKAIGIDHSTVTVGRASINQRLQFKEQQVVDVYNKLKQGLL